MMKLKDKFEEVGHSQVSLNLYVGDIPAELICCWEELLLENCTSFFLSWWAADALWSSLREVVIFST